MSKRNHPIETINLMIVSDQFDNRMKLKALQVFDLGEQSYVAVSSDDSSYGILKIVEVKGSEGRSELHDIKDDNEWQIANRYLKSNFPDILQ